MDICHDNIRRYNATILKLQEISDRLSSYRLIAFIMSVVLIIIFANERLLTLIWISVPICLLAFVLLIKRHNQVDYLKRHASFLREINEHEVLKLECKLSGFPAGQTFMSLAHPYISDLDIFGQHSLFQLINRSTTESGNVLLAEWLSAPASKNVIVERQQAVKELSPKSDWRQHFQAIGMYFKDTCSELNKLLTRMEKPPQLHQRQSKYLIFIIPLSILSTWAAIYFLSVLFLGHFEGIPPLVIWFLINAIFLKRLRPLADDIVENIRSDIKTLESYQSLIIKIESEKFHSSLLRQLQATLRQNKYSAASEIQKLKIILEVFQLRGRKRQLNHSFYSFFNNLWFLDFYLIILVEKWKKKNGSSLRAWASSVSGYEALNSLAGFHYSNPSLTFPEINDTSYNVQFEMLGHPLINPKNRISNHFSLNGCGEIAMVTGSNMAGKSTFLRTVGINMVLALMGGPCCAKSAQVSNIKIFSSMRTQDNLEEGVSSFYAELKRVEQLLMLIDGGEPILFLLDEMFKGTNSIDRHKGGFSLIKQLKELNAFGMISTHDLDLAALAGKHNLVVNYSFNSRIRDGELIFNYELTDGLCKDFNASELMKKIGIKVLSSIEEVDI